MALVNSLDPNFVGHLQQMEQVSSSADEATRLVGQRQWMMPPLNGWDGDTTDITGMNQAFDRTDLNDQYKGLVNNKAGKIGEVMITKLQIDYIATMERAFRTRHCGSIRAKLHAAARRKGQGQSSGPFSGSVALWLQRMLESAHN